MPRAAAAGALLVTVALMGVLAGNARAERVGGSTTFLPLAERLGPQVRVSGGGSLLGITLAARGVIDVGLSDVFVPPPPGMIALPVGSAWLALVPGPGVRLQAITTAQLKALWSGRIRNWRALAAGHDPVVLVLRSPSSGTALTLRALLGPPARDALQQASSGGVAATVRAVAGALGVIEWDQARSAQLRALALDGRRPGEAGYPLRVTCWAYFRIADARALEIAGRLRQVSAP